MRRLERWFSTVVRQMDVNGDGKIDAREARMMQRTVAAQMEAKLAQTAAINERTIEEEYQVRREARHRASAADDTRGDIHREWLRRRMNERNRDRRAQPKRRKSSAERWAEYRAQRDHQRWVEQRLRDKQYNKTKRNDQRPYWYRRTTRSRASTTIGGVKKKN